ncbi:uncharacterized protein [Macaca nemestrina]|uniref:uncharacterized protein isoform X2 n=1 Tax=Macaca nemestrina TaxID=9545 RepID=UPI0039B90A6E
MAAMLWLAGWWDLCMGVGEPLGSAGFPQEGRSPAGGAATLGSLPRRGSPAPGTAFAARGAGGSNQPEPAERVEQRRFVRRAPARTPGTWGSVLLDLYQASPQGQTLRRGLGCRAGLTQLTSFSTSPTNISHRVGKEGFSFSFKGKRRRTCRLAAGRGSCWEPRGLDLDPRPPLSGCLLLPVAEPGFPHDSGCRQRGPVPPGKVSGGEARVLPKPEPGLDPPSSFVGPWRESGVFGPQPQWSSSAHLHPG